MGVQDAQARVGTDLMALSEKVKYIDISTTSEANFVLEHFELINVFNFLEAMAIEVTLPDPADVIGATFIVQKIGADGTIAVKTAVGTPPSWTDVSLTASGDHVIAVSNGFDWIKLAEQAT